VRGVVAVGAEGVRRVQAIVALAFQVVPLQVFDEVVQAAVVVLPRLFLAGLPVHLTTITTALFHPD
jgi:hypothetical protein